MKPARSFFLLVLFATSAALAAPVSLDAPTNLKATVVAGDRVDLSWVDGSIGEDGFEVEISTDGVSFSSTANAAADAQFVSIGGLDSGTLFFFRVRATSGGSSSDFTLPVHAFTNPSSPKVKFAQGFGGTVKKLKFNGSAKVTGSYAVLTDDGGQAGAFWTKQKQPISQFVCHFQFRLDYVNVFDGDLADGITFCLQAKNKKTVGGGGSGMGYSGIPKSVAVKFDPYDGSSTSDTGFFANGADPSSGSIDMNGAGIDMGSTHAFDVLLAYHDGVLNEVVTDLETAAVFEQTYSVDLKGLIGKSKAFAGFTGGTGDSRALQQILNWTFAPLPTAAPSKPARLRASSNGSTVDLTWKDTSPNETAFLIERMEGTGGSFQIIGATPANVSDYSDSNVSANTDYTYRVRSTNAAGLDSAPSGTASIMTPP